MTKQIKLTKRYALTWTWKDGTTHTTPFVYRSLASAERAAEEARAGDCCTNVAVLS